jgi:hypothetical protein
LNLSTHLWALALLVTSYLVIPVYPARAQATAPPAPESQQPAASSQPGQPEKKSRQETAAEQIKKQEHQRVLGLIPSFNVSNIPNAVAMTPKQKFQLAFRSATDPVTFGIAAIDAGISQAENEYPGYGQGAQGYFKRWGASYADTFDGNMLGNALFPSLLHQDPRYFRKGSGKLGSRLWYAALTTLRCKGDNGHWQPNISNVLGNVAAGGIANLYYPSADRGAGLIFERAFTVTAEGALGAVFLEFWPDVSHKLRKKH